MMLNASITYALRLPILFPARASPIQSTAVITSYSHMKKIVNTCTVDCRSLLGEGFCSHARCVCDVQCILHGMYSTSTIVLLLLVCTGCTVNVLAVSVYYYSSKNVYSIVYIILRLHSEYKTVLRFLDGTEYSTTWSSESQYGKWYHFSNPWFEVVERESHYHESDF